MLLPPFVRCSSALYPCSSWSEARGDLLLIGKWPTRPGVWSWDVPWVCRWRAFNFSSTPWTHEPFIGCKRELRSWSIIQLWDILLSISVGLRSVPYGGLYTNKKGNLADNQNVPRPCCVTWWTGSLQTEDSSRKNAVNWWFHFSICLVNASFIPHNE